MKSFFTIMTLIMVYNPCWSQGQVYIEQNSLDSVVVITQIGGNHSTSLNIQTSQVVGYVQQSGSASHSATIDVSGGIHAFNITQSGDVSASKTFNLSMSGTGGNATIVQTSPGTQEQAGMRVTCIGPCPAGTWQYIRR